jgi:hypothetical protein
MKRLFTLFIFLFFGCSEAPQEPTQSIKTQSVSTSDLTLVFPLKIKAESLFNIDIILPQMATIKSAKLVGVSMDMGIVPIIFLPLAEPKESRYQADILLGACGLPIMQWRLEIVWIINGQTKYFDQVISVSR